MTDLFAFVDLFLGAAFGVLLHAVKVVAGSFKDSSKF